MNGRPPPLDGPGGIVVPADRLYHRGHLWILPDPTRPGHYRIGLSAYVCRWGIEVYFIENLPTPGTAVIAGGEIGLVETEKAVVQLHSPFAGRVVAVNEQVQADPSIITFDGYGAGWIVDLEGEPVGLMTAVEYVAYLQTLPPPQCYQKPSEPRA